MCFAWQLLASRARESLCSAKKCWNLTKQVIKNLRRGYSLENLTAPHRLFYKVVHTLGPTNDPANGVYLLKLAFVVAEKETPS